jgi:FeS assembly protein IscX
MMLYWEFPHEIVLALRAAYPDADVETLGITQLHQMIVTLPNFKDDPNVGYDDLLEDILGEWYEEVNT